MCNWNWKVLKNWAIWDQQHCLPLKTYSSDFARQVLVTKCYQRFFRFQMATKESRMHPPLQLFIKGNDGHCHGKFPLILLWFEVITKKMHTVSSCIPYPSCNCWIGGMLGKWWPGSILSCWHQLVSRATHFGCLPFSPLRPLQCAPSSSLLADQFLAVLFWSLKQAAHQSFSYSTVCRESFFAESKAVYLPGTASHSIIFSSWPCLVWDSL